MTLQGADLLAHRGLSHAVNLRRARETFGLREVTEDFEAFDLHTKQAEKLSGAFGASQITPQPSSEAFAERVEAIPEL